MHPCWEFELQPTIQRLRFSSSKKSLATVDLLAFRGSRPASCCLPCLRHAGCPSKRLEGTLCACGPSGVHLTGPREGFTTESSRCGSIGDGEDAVAVALKTRP